MQIFGTLPDGKAVHSFTLKSTALEMTVIEFGGRIVALKVPDRDGKLDDVVLGYDTLNDYLRESAFFGAIIGRYGNRIANGRFALNGRVYQLPQNNGANTLHGGLGFHTRLWQANTQHNSKNSLELHYLSHDGEDGFPGNLHTTVRYTLSDSDLRIDYHAVTDADTVVNLTSHGYFNLAGAGHASILDHQLVLHADRYTPVDANQIPTGELRAVTGTAFDFRQPHAIGKHIDSSDEQINFGQGYDHNWVLNHYNGQLGNEQLGLAAEVYEPDSGRVMQVLTTEPGMQFYAGNHLDGAMPGKAGRRYARRSGFCLETQHFPDSPNHHDFPSTTLKPGQVYQSTTIHRFATRS